jgi:hypothetical protein
MNNKLIKKLATIIGLGIIVLSILMAVIYFFAYIISMVLDNNINNIPSLMLSGLFTPFSYLISGLGFGSIVFLLGRMLKSDEE